MLIIPLISGSPGLSKNKQTRKSPCGAQVYTPLRASVIAEIFLFRTPYTKEKPASSNSHHWLQWVLLSFGLKFCHSYCFWYCFSFLCQFSFSTCIFTSDLRELEGRVDRWMLLLHATTSPVTTTNGTFDSISSGAA